MLVVFRSVSCKARPAWGAGISEQLIHRPANSQCAQLLHLAPRDTLLERGLPAKNDDAVDLIKRGACIRGQASLQRIT